MNLRELQKKAHAIAKDHGWWDEERTFGDCIALVYSELSEALEWYPDSDLRPRRRVVSDDPQTLMYPIDRGEEYLKRYKPVGVPSELADVVIRVADMAEHYHWDLDAVSIPEPEEWMEFSPPKSFGDWIGLCHIHASDALVKAWIPPERFQTPSVSLNLVIRTVQRMAAHYGIDLDAAIAAKLEYNKTRPYRHGGKVL